MLKTSLLSTLALISVSGVAHAQDASLAAAFTKAEGLYAARDTGLDGTPAGIEVSRKANLEARNAYQAIAKTAKGVDLVRAVEGVARTYNFEGEVLTGKTTDAEKKARKALFNACWNTVIDPISPAKLGEKSSVYFYWRAACLAREAEVSSTLERLVNLPKLLGAFSDGADAAGADTYEGGGLNRVQAAVKSNPEAKGLPGGLYNPTVALNLIDASIDSADGALYCENYYRKMTTLKTLSDDAAAGSAVKAEYLAQAQTLATETVENFTAFLAEDGLIPEIIRAETSHCVNLVSDFSASL